MLRTSLLPGAALLAALIAAGPAAADVKAGVDAWSRGDYARAVNEWRGPAQRGDADAQFNLAQAYKLGRGVPADLAKAEELFGKAAAQGHLQAADNYGLLVFQRGDHARAMPYVKAAADRGDPRSQYLLGIAYFNGDNVTKDWVRAYALVSLAQQAGLPQAAPALAQMDKYIPLADRQRSVPLASELAARAQTTRESQIAALDLGTTVPSSASAASGNAAPPRPAARTPEMVSAQNAVAAAARAAGTDSPRTAGADYARPAAPMVVTLPRPGSARAEPARESPRPSPAASAPAATGATAARPSTPARPAAQERTTTGPWRVQLGAYGVPGNAEAMWNRVKSRPELAGRQRLLVPAGRVSKLQAGGFASQADAQAACSRLKAAGFDCLAVRN